jgi:hypothetical protein
MRERRPGLVVMLGLIALLATACGASSSAKTMPASTATRAPSAPTPLSWTAATYPPGFHLPGASNETRIAIASADTAYAITDTGAPDTPLNVYVTHDRAAHWTRAATLPILLRDASAWAPVADANDPNVVTARIFLMAGGQSNFVAYDGGMTWAAIKTYLTPSSFATAQGKTYGVVDFNYPHSGVPNEGTQDWPRLAVSADRMRSWQPLSSADQRITDFWLQPATGTLVAQAQGYPNPTGLPCQASLPSSKAPCWEQSADSGRNWRVFSGAPTGGGVFQASGSTHLWRLCAMISRTRQQPDQVNCTFDGGATWSQRAGIDPAPGHDGAYVSTTILLGLTADNALLALDANPYATPARPVTVYRLAPNATQWQSLGSAPEDGVYYLDAPTPGALWSFPASGGPFDPQRRLFVAAYS